MMNLFNMGGILFMSILTIEFLVMAILAGKAVIAKEGSNKDAELMKSFGLLALVTGILGQLIGLYDAFNAIEMMGQVSPALLAGGLKISMITTLYGMVIYLISILLWIGLKVKK
jgi:biopolymer transport protein ExbB/TolQ